MFYTSIEAKLAENPITARCQNIRDVFEDVQRYIQVGRTCARRWTGQLTSVSRNRLASAAVMNAAQQVVEEKKLSAYTELSASVSKISSSASSMMAPTLAEVFLHHTECKQRADQSSAALGAAWTKIMNEFLSEINRNVEEGLRNVVERLEGQDITRMRKQGSPGLKRAWDGHEATDVGRHPSLEGGWQGKISGRKRATSDSDYGGIAPAKRRRTGGSSHTPEANDQFKDDLNPNTTSFVESLRQQMNMQDRQLQALQRENKEVGDHFMHIVSRPMNCMFVTAEEYDRSKAGV